MIEIEHISRTYKVSRRNAGFSEAFKTLFHRQYECIKAFDDISFTMEEDEMVIGYIADPPSIEEPVARLYRQYQKL